MTTYTPIVDAILKARPDIKVPDGMVAGLKFTSPTQTTYGGFEWPNPGGWTHDFGENWNRTPCKGGGVHAALTFEAAQSGGHRYTHAMIVAWRADEASEPQGGKVKARRMLSLARIDLASMIVFGSLSGANLSGSDLSGANLFRANLSGSDLSWANLSRANLSWADLSWTNLSRAYLSRADLYRADLSSAKADKGTVWPDGFDPKSAGEKVRS